MEPLKRNILLNPGPATTSDTVKYAMLVPDICPREAEFGELMRSVGSDLVDVVKGGDEYTCVFFTGSGTSVMDAAINSSVPPNAKILVVNNGAYGARMVGIAAAYGIPCVELKRPGYEDLDPSEIAAILFADESIACVAMIHHETTTGILNPLKAVGKIVKAAGRVFIVDAISSFAGIPIDIKACGVDFLLSTSNKCIQGMAGLAYVICRKTELEKLADYPKRSYYLNLWQQYDYFQKKGEMQFTPPVQILYALHQAVLEFKAEGGVEGRYARYTKNWEVLRGGLADIGFRFLLRPEQESHILLTVHDPLDPAYDFTALHDALFARGFTIYPGKIGDLPTFRLANMGAIDEHDIRDFLAALRAVLHEMNVTQF